MEQTGEIKLHGRTLIRKNGLLIFDSSNIILNELRQYAADVLNEDVGTFKAISDPLLDENKIIDEVPYTGSQDGKSGIILADASTSFYGTTVFKIATMITTDISAEASGNYAKKFRGVYTADGAQQFGAALLGHAITLDETEPPIKPFDTEYARQSFSTITLADGDQITVEWEIQVS